MQTKNKPVSRKKGRIDYSEKTFREIYSDSSQLARAQALNEFCSGGGPGGNRRKKTSLFWPKKAEENKTAGDLGRDGNGKPDTSADNLQILTAKEEADLVMRLKKEANRILGKADGSAGQKTGGGANRGQPAVEEQKSAVLSGGLPQKHALPPAENSTDGNHRRKKKLKIVKPGAVEKISVAENGEAPADLAVTAKINH